MSDRKRYSELSREELFELVWSSPMTKLAKEFGLSDQGLRKVCVTKQIPLPKAGHWAKAAAGRTPPRTPLPEYSDVVQERRDRAVRKQRSALRRMESANWQPPPDEDEGSITWHRAIAQLRKGIRDAAKKARRLKMASEWEEAHPGRDHPDRKRYDLYGSWKYRADKGGLVVETHKRYPFRISLVHYERGLRVLNAILVRASADGYKVGMAKDGDRIEVSQKDYSVDLRITEKLEVGYRKELNSWSKKYENVKVLNPTGRLAVYVEPGGGGEVAITDKVGGYLENRLDEVMDVISRQIAATEKWRKEWEERQRQYKEEERRRAEMERQRELERQRLAKEEALNAAIVKEAETWAKANTLKLYLQELDSRLSKGGVVMEGYSEWRKRAETFAASLDPSGQRVRPNDESQ